MNTYLHSYRPDYTMTKQLECLLKIKHLRRHRDKICTSGDTIYRLVTHFFIGLCNLNLVPGNKFLGRQFTKLVYTRNVGGRRGVSRENLILLREGWCTIKMSIRSSLIMYLSVGSNQQ